EVLDARLHALWDPSAAQDRLTASTEIVELARRAGDRELERRGMFWRFVALMELGRIGEAESALAAFRHAALAAGDEADLVMVAARDAMLATVRGRFDQALAIVDEVEREAVRIGLPDRVQIVGTLRGGVSLRRPTPEQTEHNVQILMTAARLQPGHFFEATAARVMVFSGRHQEAAAELRRMLPIV